jgi:Ca-activated chloride channel family protein
MNVGNLQAGDTIDLSIMYAELFKWRRNALRFFLPTTIAPRYGSPDSVGVQPHQAPEYDLANENPFAITLTVSGALTRAALESPSHEIVSEFRAGTKVISLKDGSAFMDRDFVLNLSMESDEKSAAHVETDGDDYIALASFYPGLPSVGNRPPRSITIVLDCSGSMGGDAIAQARKALYEILELLRPEDWFNIVRFGSSYQMLFSSTKPADAGNLKKARDLLEVLDADMGGTEVGQAIAASVRGGRTDALSREALLITDGEVWDWEKATRLAYGTGTRFFTVGVGNAVSEAFVQTLADVTGGACELVSPREDMAEKIIRHFKRIYFPRASNVEIRWPVEPEKTFPEKINAVYEGDTLHVFGRFKAKPEGDVELQADLENGERLVERIPLIEAAGEREPSGLPGTTARMAAALEMRKSEDPDEIAALALKYQLMSRFTNYLAIDVQAGEEKAKDLPALRKTPQMLAAGWGGAGTVLNSERMEYRPAAPMFSRARIADYGDAVACYSIKNEENYEIRNLDRFIDRLNRLQPGLFTPVADMTSINQLEAQALPGGFIEALAELVEAGFDEETVVTVFLYLLSQHQRIVKRLDRSTRRILAKTYKQLPGVPATVERRIETAIEDCLKTMGIA